MYDYYYIYIIICCWWRQAREYVMYMILEEAIYEKHKNANTRNEWSDSLRYQMSTELAQMFLSAVQINSKCIQKQGC